MGAHRDSFGTLDFVRNLPLFAGLEAAELEAIAGVTVEQRVPAGTVLYRRDDPCDGFHVIAAGRVKLALLAPGGAEKVVEILGPGDSFGEGAMFRGGRHALYAEALTDALLLFMRGGAMLDAIERSPALARRMLGEISQRLYRLIADIEAYTMKSATERITGYLIAALGEETGSAQPFEIELPASKSALASRLNVTREHFSRILHELSQSGLIRVSGRRIRILDSARLRSRAS